jgi:EmrB/QacA subfamily drug resistance transporter
MAGDTLAPPADRTGAGRPGPRIAVSQKTAVGIVYVTGLFLSILDSTIVNVALPTIGRVFAVAPTAIDSVSISYLVSLAVFVPASGWLGDRFGGKRTLLCAIAVFTVGSALCGTATSLGELVAFRVLQGMGGGMLASVGMAMLLRAFPAGERVALSAVLSIANGLAPSLGPVLGGVLVTDVSWRAIFYVNVPIGIFAVVFGVLYLRNEPTRPAEPFDVAGFALAGAGLGLLMYGLSEGPDMGWGTAGIVASLLAGAGLLVAAVIVELRKRLPLLDVRLLKDRLFASGTTAMTVQNTTFLAAVYTMTLYLQDERGLSALRAGLNTFPQALGVLAGSQLASRVLYRALGPRLHLMLGVLGTSVVVALMALLGPDTSTVWVSVLLIAMGACVGQVFVNTQSASFATVSADASGRASTLFNVGRRLGGAVGVALATTVLVSVTAGAIGPHGGPDAAAYRAAFLTIAAFNLLGLYAARRVNDEDAASTIPARRRDNGRTRRPRRAGVLPIPSESSTRGAPSSATAKEN